ncbi:MAG: hypothetical protein Q4G34_09785, partial [Micrococcus sp.]|nr:hypothetical protein [Micrococcus sp.]
MPRTASHSDSRLRVSARTATSLVTLTLLLSACGSTPADDTEAEAASPTSPATSPASADTSSLTASPTSPGLTASPTT